MSSPPKSAEMRQLQQGWQVVCPDGEIRLYPHINKGDAECDARVVDKSGVCEPVTVDGRKLPCPGGKHEVRSVAFVLPPPVAVA